MCSFAAFILSLFLVIGFHKPNCVMMEIDSLVLVTATFRNGQATAGRTYPTDPNINLIDAPYRNGRLVEEGIRSSAELGRFLRKRYDRFLGNWYSPDIVNASAQDATRTRSSLEVVLENIWPLETRPFSYNNISSYSSSTLSFPPETCSVFNTTYTSYMNSPNGRNLYNRYRYIYDYVQNNTELNIDTVMDLYLFYFTLTGEDDNGFKLPNWTHLVYPRKLREAAIDFLYSTTATPELRRITGGFLLGQIVNDMQRKINNDWTFNDMKLILYSAQVFSLPYEMIVMDVFFPHISSYSACIIIELHRINGNYGVKILYKQINDTMPITLTIPGCTSICPFSQFLNIVQDNIPSSCAICGFA